MRRGARLAPGIERQCQLCPSHPQASSAFGGSTFGGSSAFGAGASGFGQPQVRTGPSRVPRRPLAPLCATLPRPPPHRRASGSRPRRPPSAPPPSSGSPSSRSSSSPRPPASSAPPPGPPSGAPPPLARPPAAPGSARPRLGSRPPRPSGPPAPPPRGPPSSARPGPRSAARPRRPSGPRRPPRCAPLPPRPRCFNSPGVCCSDRSPLSSPIPAGLLPLRPLLRPRQQRLLLRRVPALLRRWLRSIPGRPRLRGHGRPGHALRRAGAAGPGSPRAIGGTLRTGSPAGQ